MLPAAEREGGVAVADPIAGLVATMSPRSRALVRLALRALELSSPPRRFSRLEPRRAARRLATLERSRIGARRDVALLVKTLTSLGYARDERVQAAVGSSAGCRRAGGATSAAPGAPPLDRGAMAAPEGVERCDVVIVGSGAGGAAAARVLAERGLDVIVVEEGGYHDARDYSRDPLRALPDLYRDGGLTFCEGTPSIPMPLGRAVGGTTVVNSGTCFRTPDEVLARWRDEFGIGWASDLDGEFEALERDLDVRAVDPEHAGRNTALCRTGAEALGVSHGPLKRNAPDVVCCSSCPTGCALDAKRAMHVSELPRAVAAGARIRAGVRVGEVIVAQGRAAGIVARRESDGARYEVRARAVILAAGAIGTPELLLKGALANSSGAVGRHLRVHPACWVGALHDEPVRGWDGVMQGWGVDEWSDRGLFLESTFTPLGFGAHWLRGAGEPFERAVAAYDRLAIIGVHLSERSEGRVRVGRSGRARISYSLRADDARDIAFGIARAAEIHFAAGAGEVYPQVGRLDRLAPGEQRQLDGMRVRPRELRLEAFHPLGTARMGTDPRHTVVGPEGESHDLPGLYVADASVLPTSLKVNPMITIMACARRISAGLAARLA